MTDCRSADQGVSPSRDAGFSARFELAEGSPYHHRTAA
jgi:hypothetical protein